MKEFSIYIDVVFAECNKAVERLLPLLPRQEIAILLESSNRVELVQALSGVDFTLDHYKEDPYAFHNLRLLSMGKEKEFKQMFTTYIHR